ncbi:MAG: hypothetical protein GY761_19180 [Hyphomicrobiales bacterium]|nr:hypothetical protein [Hyphomicrobiales bacterium]
MNKHPFSGLFDTPSACKPGVRLGKGAAVAMRSIYEPMTPEEVSRFYPCRAGDTRSMKRGHPLCVG